MIIFCVRVTDLHHSVVRMEVQTLVFIILTLLISFIKEGVSIVCYKCNSHIHYNDCKDIKTLSEERRIGNDTRIIRQCAVLGEDDGKCTLKTGTKNIKMEYCECNKDLCNSALHYTANYYSVLTLFVLPFLLRRFQTCDFFRFVADICCNI
ncbi:hypothetical protein KUTeg_003333 [Tegillarca granosa]|uniref:Protein sleepless n=1 Tax=Tegillarca granosa TaxID=220873 RepID=A0ABQ9FNN8_TEGGR|nr:hypothetical protein KUTeg_003333 [Tegillarca granosa]